MLHDQTPRLLTKEDLCSRLSVSPRTVENMVKAGEFPHPVRIGKRVYWSETAVVSWHRRLFAEQEAWATASALNALGAGGGLPLP